MKRLLLMALLAALPLAAQDQGKKQDTPPPKPEVQKLFILKYADPRTIADLLRVFNATVVANTEMHALAVTTAQQNMAAIEEAISRLDVAAAAPKNIDLTCYLMIGTEGDGTGGSLPKDLDSVVAQLKNAFPFKTYRVMDVLTMRGRTGQRLNTSSQGGTMQAGGATQALPVYSQFAINSATVGADGSTVRIDGIRTSSRVPITNPSGGVNYQDLGISTDVDIKEGQKVVIGRMGITHDQALFLVLMAKVVN